MWKNLLLALTLAFGSTALLTACEQDGPMEEAGEKMDESMERTGEKMEEAGEKIERKAEDARN